MIELSDINNKELLIQYLKLMAVEAKDADSKWENHDLSSFFNAMVGWIEDMDGYYLNKGEIPPVTPSWKTIAEILRAATVYE